MKSESDVKLLSDYLSDVGCCRICVLRFLDPNIDDFLDVENSLLKVSFPDVHMKLFDFPCVITEEFE
jgi:hypothetical protein